MLSDRIKWLRKTRGLSQLNLAEALNVSQATIASYETGARRPDWEMIIRLADYFNVSIDYLAERTTEAKQPEDEPITDDALAKKHFALKRITYGFDSEQMDDMLDLAAIVDRRSKHGKANNVD